MTYNPDEKPIREKDKAYLEYIKTCSCLTPNIACVGDIVPHHTTSVGAGGSDYTTVPLCLGHHTAVHYMGGISFQKVYNISFGKEIIRLLIGYINDRKAKK